MILTKPQPPATTTSTSARPIVLLVDLTNVAHVAWHGFRGNVDLPRFVIHRIGELAAIWQCSRVVCATDSERSFRRDIDPGYKSHRPATDPSLAAAVEETRRAAADRWSMIGALGYEADDAIATAVRCAREAGCRVIVLSGDKDLFQCLAAGELTICRAARSNRNGGFDCDWMTERSLYDSRGVLPSQWADWQALVGDKTDGIVGAKGIGPKTATELLTAAESLESLLTEPEKFSTKPSVMESLQEFRSRAAIVRQLVTLRTDCPLVQEVFA